VVGARLQIASVILRIARLPRKTLAVVFAWLGSGQDSTAEPHRFFHAISTENFVDNIFDEVYASQLIIVL